MKKIILFICLFLSANSLKLSAQSTTCEPNMDFENGNYGYWSFFQGRCCSPFSATTAVTPPSAGRIALTSGTGTDYYGGFPVVSPGGGSYSLKLGSDDNDYKADKARYLIHVPAGSTKFALVYRYAVVLEDPKHSASDQPRFTVTTIDSATGTSIACSQFSYVAGALPGFNTSPRSSSVYYKSWASAIIDLSGSAGRTVIVDFTRGCCGQGAHFGYGYIDMNCGLFATTINSCFYSAKMVLNGPPGFQSYTWMDSAMTTVIATGQTPTITTPTVTTTYKLILSPFTGFGCADTLTTQIVISPLSITTPKDSTLCKGDTMTLKTTVTGDAGPFSYNWTPSTGLSCTGCANPLLTATSTTKYFFVATDTNGCSRRDSISVKVKPLPNVRASDKIICFGDTVLLNATGAKNYVWKIDTTLSCDTCFNPTVKTSITRSYYLSGVDTNGCANKDTVIVKVNPLPIVNAIDKIICKNDTASLLATGAKNYVWSPSTALSCSTCPAPKASPGTSTYYVVTGTDSNSCKNKDSVLVKVNTLPNVIGSDKQICINDSVMISATGAQTYNWTPITGLSCTNCPNPTASPRTTTNYIVTGTDSNSCKNKDTITVKVNPLPTLSKTADFAICKDYSSTLFVAGASKYKWSPSIGLSCDTCSTTIATLSNNIKYRIMATDANGCINYDSISISINYPQQITLDSVSPICLGDSIKLLVSGSNSYSWSPTASLSCSNCASPFAKPTTSTTYTVIGTDINSCKDTASIFIEVNPLPQIVCSKDSQICDGNSIKLWATGAKNYTWSPSTALSCTNCDSPLATPKTPTTYTVQGTDTNGCKNTARVNVSIFYKSPISYSPNDTICDGEKVYLYANGGTYYTWLPTTGLNTNNIANPIASPTNTTLYKLIINQGICFVDTVDVKITVNPAPKFEIKGDSIIYLSQQAKLFAEGSNMDKYKWSPSEYLNCSDCPNPVATIEQNTVFTLNVQSSAGCTLQKDFAIKVKCDQSKVFIPNTFTPNGDGENDTFYPMGGGIKTVKDFVIYNRWGELVFEAHNITLNNHNTGWDGTLKGKPLNPDVFIYHINATCLGGEDINFKGNISLIK